MKWKEISGIEGYRISDTGVIQSQWAISIGQTSLKLKRWRTLSSKCKKGYVQVTLRIARGKKKIFPVHILVLTTFVSPRPNDLFGLHRNDNKSDNRLKNLYWGTLKDNANDRKKNGHRLCKLSDSDVDEIRKSSLSDTEEAKKRNVSSNYIYKIRCFAKRNGGDFSKVKKRGIFRKLTDKQVKYIRNSPKTTAELSELYNVTKYHISKIRRNKIRIEIKDD